MLIAAARRWFWWGVLLFALLFVPWVWVLHLGVLFYFPYKPDGHHRFVRTLGPLTHDWTPFEHIPKSCIRALIAAEDTRFYEHFGIDLQSIEQAFALNEKAGKKRLGASTITQQLVKNIFLSREKSYLRKIREIIGAVLLDAIMSKEQQLVWYFNAVEFGPLVYGLQQASAYYYSTKPKYLSKDQCITLVSLLPSPRRSSAYIKAGKASPYLQKRIELITRMSSQ